MIRLQIVKNRVYIIQNDTINKRNFHVIFKNIVIAGPSFAEVIRS